MSTYSSIVMLLRLTTTSICKAISASRSAHTKPARAPSLFGAPIPSPELSRLSFILCGLRDRTALEGALLWTKNRRKAKVKRQFVLFLWHTLKSTQTHRQKVLRRFLALITHARRVLSAL